MKINLLFLCFSDSVLDRRGRYFSSRYPMCCISGKWTLLFAPNRLLLCGSVDIRSEFHIALFSSTAADKKFRQQNIPTIIARTTAAANLWNFGARIQSAICPKNEVAATGPSFSLPVSVCHVLVHCSINAFLGRGGGGDIWIGRLSAIFLIDGWTRSCLDVESGCWLGLPAIRDGWHYSQSICRTPAALPIDEPSW